eukprot:755538-Hanusia_phi.AAC.3
MKELSTKVRGSCSDCMLESSEKFKDALEGCKLMQEKEQKQLLVKVLEQLQAMQSKLDNVEAHPDIQGKLDEAINVSRSAVCLLNRLCLAQSESTMAPYLIWIYPAERKKSLMSRLNPKHWFYDKVYIQFICPVSLKVCEERFETREMRSWFKRALPYFKAAMLVLQLALSTATCMGLPCPPLDLVQMPSESRELAAVKALSAFVSEIAVEENIDLKPLEDQLDACQRQQERFDAAIPERLRSSNRTIVELMESIDR